MNYELWKVPVNDPTEGLNVGDMDEPRIGHTPP